jgi:hypothetical protein
MYSCLYAIEFKDKTWKVGGSNNAISRLNAYKGPCKPIFCVVQLVRQYNIHEYELIDEMKKSDEWELSDGHEYFAPQISSEDARKWITHHFNKINPSLSSFSGIKEDICLYLKDQAKCTQKYLGSLEDWKDLDKIEETGCTNATEYQCEYCLKKHNTFDALRKHNKRHSVYECKSKLAKQRIDKMDPIKVVDIINASARTNELLAQLLEDNKVLKSQINDLTSEIKNACKELRE